MRNQQETTITCDPQPFESNCRNKPKRRKDSYREQQALFLPSATRGGAVLAPPAGAATVRLTTPAPPPVRHDRRAHLRRPPASLGPPIHAPAASTRVNPTTQAPP